MPDGLGLIADGWASARAIDNASKASELQYLLEFPERNTLRLQRQPSIPRRPFDNGDVLAWWLCSFHVFRTRAKEQGSPMPTMMNLAANIT
jgi:hypothetical protein